MNISRLLTASLSLQAEPEVGTVVFTGITIVFFVLLLLFVVITIQGVIFKNMEKTKKSISTEQPLQPMVENNANIAKAPVIEAGISSEVIAAITAAVTCFEGAGNFTIKSVKRAKQSQNAWGNAAAISYTQPF